MSSKKQKNIQGNIIGNKIKEQMRFLDLSNKEVAQKLNVSQPTISNYLNGNRSPDPYTILMLCQLLRLNVYSLYNLEECDPRMINSYTRRIGTVLQKLETEESKERFICAMEELANFFQ